MIKLEELRIGNLVAPSNAIYNEQFIKVESLNTFQINIDFRPYDLNNIKPIPITEDWLLKLGFCPLDHLDEKWYELDQNLIKVGDRIYIKNEEFDYKSMTVHKLQNIFYFLRRRIKFY